MKALKTILKILGALVGILILAGASIFLYYNESMPENTEGAEAEALADKMLAAINKTAWDTTAVIQWQFRGPHDYIWDKDRHVTQVKWDDYEVYVDLKTVKGVAFKGGQKVEGAEGDALVQQAWEFWCNDSFWLNAPAKCKDGGTVRSVVDLEDGKKGLMVSYKGGGATPGDSYLWILDDEGKPTSYKMWVSIIPIGGVEATWSDWTTTETGAKIAQSHNLDLGLTALDIPISNVKTAASWETFGLEKDIFEVLK